MGVKAGQVVEYSMVRWGVMVVFLVVKDDCNGVLARRALGFL